MELQLKKINFSRFKSLKFSNAQKQAFFEDLVSLMKEGISTKQAVLYIAESTSGTSKEIANHILQNITEGQSITKGLQQWFPFHIIELIRAGEEGGSLIQTLQAAASSLNLRHDTLQIIIQALTYPIAVLLTGLGVMIFMNQTVLKQFQALLPLSDWPTTGKTLVMLANFLMHWGIFLAILPIFLGIILFKVLQNYIGKYRTEIDHLPIFSLYKRLTASYILQILGLLLKNGITLKKALKIVKASSNSYLAWHLIEMEKRLSFGKDNIADVLNTGLFDDHTLSRLRLMAHGKAFEDALIRQSDFTAKQLNRRIQQSAKLIGYLLLGLGGCLAVFLVFGLYSTGFALTGQ